MTPRTLTLAALFALASAGIRADQAQNEHAEQVNEAHGHEGHADDAHPDHLTEIDDLRIVHAWTRATTADHALVFMEIENTGEPAMLTGAETPLAERATLVGFRMTEAGGVYETLPQLPVAKGTELALAPEGLALRLDGLSAPLAEGDVVPVKLHFGTTSAEVSAEVEAADARQHSHAGHAH